MDFDGNGSSSNGSSNTTPTLFNIGATSPKAPATSLFGAFTSPSSSAFGGAGASSTTQPTSVFGSTFGGTNTSISAFSNNSTNNNTTSAFGTSIFGSSTPTLAFNNTNTSLAPTALPTTFSSKNNATTALNPNASPFQPKNPPVLQQSPISTPPFIKKQKKLYVTGIPFAPDANKLKTELTELFSNHGTIVSIQLIRKLNKYHAIVEYSTIEEATDALRKVKSFKNTLIIVKAYKPSKDEENQIVSPLNTGKSPIITNSNNNENNSNQEKERQLRLLLKNKSIAAHAATVTENNDSLDDNNEENIEDNEDDHKDENEISTHNHNNNILNNNSMLNNNNNNNNSILSNNISTQQTHTLNSILKPSSFQNNHIHTASSILASPKQTTMTTSSLPAQQSNPPATVHSLNSASKVGLCLEMCPLKERQHRETSGDINTLERLPNGELLFVKKYKRNVAEEHSEIPPEEIRPPHILSKVMNHLTHNVADRKGIPFKEIQNFIRDRSRSLRQDLTSQHCQDDISIDIHERCVRFHIVSHHYLCEEKEQDFNQFQNQEQLNNCLTSLKLFYDDHFKATGTTYPNEAEIRSYYILNQMDHTSDMVSFLIAIPEILRQHPFIRYAVDVWKAFRHENYSRFFKLASKGTYLQACLLHKYFNRVRVMALTRMSKAFGAKSSGPYPLADLSSMLLFSSSDEVVEFLTTLDISVESEHIIFRGIYVDSTKKIPPKVSKLISSKAPATFQLVIDNPEPIPIGLCLFLGIDISTVPSSILRSKPAIDSPIISPPITVTTPTANTSFISPSFNSTNTQYSIFNNKPELTNIITSTTTAPVKTPTTTSFISPSISSNIKDSTLIATNLPKPISIFDKSTPKEDETKPKANSTTSSFFPTTSEKPKEVITFGDIPSKPPVDEKVNQTAPILFGNFGQTSKPSDSTIVSTQKQTPTTAPISPLPSIFSNISTPPILPIQPKITANDSIFGSSSNLDKKPDIQPIENRKQKRQLDEDEEKSDSKTTVVLPTFSIQTPKNTTNLLSPSQLATPSIDYTPMKLSTPAPSVNLQPVTPHVPYTPMNISTKKDETFVKYTPMVLSTPFVEPKKSSSSVPQFPHDLISKEADIVIKKKSAESIPVVQKKPSKSYEEKSKETLCIYLLRHWMAKSKQYLATKKQISSIEQMVFTAHGTPLSQQQSLPLIPLKPSSLDNRKIPINNKPAENIVVRSPLSIPFYIYDSLSKRNTQDQRIYWKLFVSTPDNDDLSSLLKNILSYQPVKNNSNIWSKSESLTNFEYLHFSNDGSSSTQISHTPINVAIVNSQNSQNLNVRGVGCILFQFNYFFNPDNEKRLSQLLNQVSFGDSRKVPILFIGTIDHSSLKTGIAEKINNYINKNNQQWNTIISNWKVEYVEEQTTDSSKFRIQMKNSLVWLSKYSPLIQPIDLIPLSSILENVLTHKLGPMLRPYYIMSREPEVELTSQLATPFDFIGYYNQLIQQLGILITNNGLTTIDWPIPEFTFDSSNLTWNSEKNFQSVSNALKSISLPSFPKELQHLIASMLVSSTSQANVGEFKSISITNDIRIIDQIRSWLNQFTNQENSQLLLSQIRQIFQSFDQKLSNLRNNVIVPVPWHIIFELILSHQISTVPFLNCYYHPDLINHLSAFNKQFTSPTIGLIQMNNEVLQPKISVPTQTKNTISTPNGKNKELTLDDLDGGSSPYNSKKREHSEVINPNLFDYQPDMKHWRSMDSSMHMSSSVDKRNKIDELLTSLAQEKSENKRFEESLYKSNIF